MEAKILPARHVSFVAPHLHFLSQFVKGCRDRPLCVAKGKIYSKLLQLRRQETLVGQCMYCCLKDKKKILQQSFFLPLVGQCMYCPFRQETATGKLARDLRARFCGNPSSCRSRAPCLPRAANYRLHYDGNPASNYDGGGEAGVLHGNSQL